MPLVLSTKILSPVQKKHLFLANISVLEYNAVEIKPIEITLKQTHFEYAIFTSQNAVKIAKQKGISIKHAFCVGPKTAKLAEGISDKIVVVEDNAKALAEVIAQNYKDVHFHFFCSEQRRDELPDLLNQNGIKLTEHNCYRSVVNPKTFKNKFDAVLCFSPLGAKAYYDNHSQKPLAICIGETTAQAVRHYTDKVELSKQKSIESVVVKAIKRFTSLP